MSRFSRGTCCAVVVMLGLGLSAQMSAEEQAGNPFFQSEKRGSYESAEERIEAILDRPLRAPLEFTELPLYEIVNILQDEYDLPIVFDHAALDEVAVSAETEITVNLRNLSLRSAINLMLRQPGVEELTYVIDNEVLLITTADRASSTLTIRMYRVDDFDLSWDTPSRETIPSQGYSSLVEAITTCVSFNSWQENETGEGQLVLVKPGILVVANTRRVQEAVENFLDQLRLFKARIERDPETASRF